MLASQSTTLQCDETGYVHTWWLSHPLPKPPDNMLGFVQEVLAIPDRIDQRKPVQHLVVSARVLLIMIAMAGSSTHCQGCRVPERIASISGLVGAPIEPCPL